jgi:AcrR family transcriptional regulator
MASRRISTCALRPSPARRRRIVDAATRLFSATRYDAVQIDDVARAAGVAKPTLYRYFATKEDLFLEALDTLFGEIAGELTEIVETCGEARQAVLEMIGILLDRLGGNHSGVRLFDGSEKRFGPNARSRLRARTAQIRAALAAVVRRGVEQGEFRDVDPDFVALAIIGSLRMVATRIPDRRRAAAAHAIAAILLDGISTHTARADLAPPLHAVAQADALGVG